MYGLESGDRYEIKRIAGKIDWMIHSIHLFFILGRIVPAIGTTTATVSGLVNIQIEICFNSLEFLFRLPLNLLNYVLVN